MNRKNIKFFGIDITIQPTSEKVEETFHSYHEVY